MDTLTNVLVGSITALLLALVIAAPIGFIIWLVLDYRNGDAEGSQLHTSTVDHDKGGTHAQRD